MEKDARALDLKIKNYFILSLFDKALMFFLILISQFLGLLKDGNLEIVISFSNFQT